MKKILIPTDFSKNALHALHYAFSFTHKEPHQVLLLHTFEAGYDLGSLLAQRIGPLESEKKQQMEVLIQNLQEYQEAAHLSFQGLVHHGDLARTVADICAKEKIDLVLMGTQGESNASNRVFGSETARIISQGKCPVLAVPKEAKAEPIKHFFFATDYREGDLEVLEKIVAEARHRAAKVHVLHIAPESNLQEQIQFRGFRDIVKERISYDKVVCELIIHPQFLEGMASYIALHEQALLTMSYHKKSFLASLFTDSRAEDMVYVSPVPLWVYPV